MCLGLKIEEFIFNPGNSNFSKPLNNAIFKGWVSEIHKDVDGYTDFTRTKTNLEFNEFSSGFSRSESESIDKFGACAENDV